MVNLFFSQLSTAVQRIFLDPTQRTFWPLLLASVVVTALFQFFFTKKIQLSGKYFFDKESIPSVFRSLFSKKIWSHPSTFLDVKLLFVGIVFKILLFSTGLFYARGFSRFLLRNFYHFFGGAPEINAFNVLVPLLFAIILFVGWDFSRYLVHYSMHRSEFFWRFHSIHHTAEAMTPLTLFRVHPVETLLMQTRRVLVTGLLTAIFFYFWQRNATEIQILGVNAFTFTASAVFSNLRHSHVFLSFGVFELFFLSPAQHQIHHSAAPEHQDKNLGTWLSLWDHLFGTFLKADLGPPERFGVPGLRHTSLKDALLARRAEAAGHHLPTEK